MRGLFTTAAWTIEPGQAVSGIARRPETFRILDGDVWITVEGVSHDYWLAAGDEFTAMPDRLVVVEAGHGTSRIAAVTPSRGRFLRDIASALPRLRMPAFLRPAAARTTLKQNSACSECC